LATEITKEAFKTGKTIRRVACEQTGLSEEDLDELLDAKINNGELGVAGDVGLPSYVK
jgi:fumarate hydratase class II